MRPCYWGGLVILSCACASTTAAYDGPRRPAAEVSTIRSFDFEIETVDARSGGYFSNRFEVLPGQHLLVVRMQARRERGTATSRTSQRFCFTSQPGRDYVVIPRAFAPKFVVDGISFLWTAEVYDQGANSRLSVRFLKPGDAVCPPPLLVHPWKQEVSAPSPVLPDS